MRNSLAHPEPPPTLAEIVAGTMAMLEVLRDHGKLSAVQQIQSRLSALQEASWLQSGSAPPPATQSVGGCIRCVFAGGLL